MTDQPTWPQPVHTTLTVADVPVYSDNALREACAKARAAERQRCQIAIRFYADENFHNGGPVFVALQIAADLLDTPAGVARKLPDD